MIPRETLAQRLKVMASSAGARIVAEDAWTLLVTGDPEPRANVLRRAQVASTALRVDLGVETTEDGALRLRVARYA